VALRDGPALSHHRHDKTGEVTMDPERRQPHETVVVAPPAGPARPAPAAGGGDLTDELLATDIWTDVMLADAGIPVHEVPLVTVGAGIGSFVFCDFMRIGGTPAKDIAVLGSSATPWETYEYLTRVSQIPRHEVLRSDSISCPDNIWGFPSYATREAFAAKGARGFIAPLFQKTTESVFTDYFTPRAGQVFEGLQREADRIRYWDMLHRGQVRMVRRRRDGGYFTILTPAAGTSPTKRIAFQSRHVHLSLGYPGVRFLPDLQAYRQTTGDYSRVVNAYEPHEHVYEELLRRGGTVVVRGSGIVASRVLQRLMDDVEKKGAKTRIAHLFRHYIDGPQGPNPWMRRPGANGFAYQGFNFTRGSWGGQHTARLQHMEDPNERAAFSRAIGGTNTPRRKYWQRQIARSRRAGTYRTYEGVVKDVIPGDNGMVRTRFDTAQGVVELEANFVVDATGLEGDIAENRVLADLLEHSGARRNGYDRLDVDRTFEVRGTRSGDGVLYAIGSMTLGGYYAPVDSFLGLQYASLRVMDDLAARGFGRRLGPARSASQWIRWMFNRPV
jgi:hypothetical protein